MHLWTTMRPSTRLPPPVVRDEDGAQKNKKELIPHFSHRHCTATRNTMALRTTTRLDRMLFQLHVVVLLCLFQCFCCCCYALSPRLYGINYSLKQGPDWDPNRCKNREQVEQDLRQLKKDVTDRIRLFSMGDCDTAGIVLSLAPSIGIQVWLGIWVGPDEIYFNDERTRLLQILEDSDTDDFSTVLGIHVSSEAIYREEITVEQALDLHAMIRDDVDAAGYTDLPVTVCDIIDTNLVYPQLSRLDPRVTTFNQFPFWERTVNITNSKDYMRYRVSMIENQIASTQQQIIITETGWADAGSNQFANIANPQSMAQWMYDFVCLAQERQWNYFWFDAYDSDWRRIQENLTNDVEGHFGIYHANGTMKEILQGLVIDCEETIPVFTNSPISPTTAAPAPAPTTGQPVTLAPITATTTPTVTPTNPPTQSTVPEEIDSESPSLVPTIVTSTAVPSVEIIATTKPTPSPTIAPVAPTTTSSPTATPNAAEATTTPVLDPTIAPMTTPTTSAPVVAPNNNTNGTTATNAPVYNPPQCQRNAACAALNLTGQCCPTIDDWTLACCGQGPVQELCQGNTRCTELELTGSCCPTTDGRYLDCCEIVPDVCLENGIESPQCRRYSAELYKLELEQNNTTNERSGGGISSHNNNNNMKWLAVVGMMMSIGFLLC